jgi:hypothetical protein
LKGNEDTVKEEERGKREERERDKKRGREGKRGRGEGRGRKRGNTMFSNNTIPTSERAEELFSMVMAYVLQNKINTHLQHKFKLAQN